MRKLGDGLYGRYNSIIWKVLTGILMDSVRMKAIRKCAAKKMEQKAWKEV